MTSDTLFAGALALRQPARTSGYRVNVDAILLAAFAARALPGGEPRRAAPARHAVDLGSGVGAVGLSLLHLGGARSVTMIEIDASAARLASENASANGWAERIDVVCVPVSDAAPDGRLAELVVCNPPYVTPGRGRPPPGRSRTARWGELGGFVEAARRFAGRRAKVAFVYPATAALSLLAALRASGLEPKRLRAVHGRAGDKARVVLVEAVPAKPGGLAIEPPLVETDGARRAAALGDLLAAPRAVLGPAQPQSRSSAIAQAARTLR